MSLPTNPEVFARFMQDFLSRESHELLRLYEPFRSDDLLTALRTTSTRKSWRESDPVFTWKDESPKTAPSDSESGRTGTDTPVKEVTIVLRRGYTLSELSLSFIDPSNSSGDSGTT